MGFEFGLAYVGKGAKGAAHNLEKVPLIVDARSNLGAMSIDNTTRKNDVKSRTFSVLFGVEIPLAH
jgi:hypothetical protein